MAHVTQVVKVQEARLFAMPRGARLYERLHNVLVIDTASHEVVDEVDLSEAGPSGLYAIDAVMTPDGEKLYLADDFSGIIGVVDTATNQVSASVNVGEWWPTGKGNRLAVAPDGRFVYAALESNQVPVIDVATDSVVKVIALGSKVQRDEIARFAAPKAFPRLRQWDINLPKACSDGMEESLCPRIMRTNVGNVSRDWTISLSARTCVRLPVVGTSSLRRRSTRESLATLLHISYVSMNRAVLSSCTLDP